MTRAWLHQVPASWHDTSITASNVALGATARNRRGNLYYRPVTDNDHAKDTGILTAESTIDSVILYGAMKAIFARQRPYTGAGEGKFFSGNWTNGSFPPDTLPLRGPSPPPWRTNITRPG